MIVPPSPVPVRYDLELESLLQDLQFLVSSDVLKLPLKPYRMVSTNCGASHALEILLAFHQAGFSRRCDRALDTMRDFFSPIFTLHFKGQAREPFMAQWKYSIWWRSSSSSIGPFNFSGLGPVQRLWCWFVIICA